ncbi:MULTISPECIES: hypothetical protein [unclassified Mycobacterium]|uniref:hypothetical protein n=1 Tax=unclassified Mycobacterium TaxID=2642494 RepID=UPI0008004621|nr:MULTISPECIES: hypothetical protein [unclassified Mycobacterium]OBG56221.1 hypothetical protein A5703_06520 [Mycobacterium sp. E188]OBH37514.1 hypothetical protein A5691_02580 [Mycobacterium sp. E183]
MANGADGNRQRHYRKPRVDVLALILSETVANGKVAPRVTGCGALPDSLVRRISDLRQPVDDAARLVGGYQDLNMIDAQSTVGIA